MNDILKKICITKREVINKNKLLFSLNYLDSIIKKIDTPINFTSASTKAMVSNLCKNHRVIPPVKFLTSSIVYPPLKASKHMHYPLLVPPLKFYQ